VTETVATVGWVRVGAYALITDPADVATVRLSPTGRRAVALAWPDP
jgi:hypothetical protein